MKIRLVLILTALSALLAAAPVDPEQARQTAAAFLAHRSQQASVTDLTTLDTRGETCAYVIALDTPGFIVVPGDDLLPPVLAYSLKENFTDGGELRRMIEKDVSLRMEWLRSQSRGRNRDWDALRDGDYGSRTFQQWPADGSTRTDGWILTTWDQTGLLNDMCPLDDTGERSVVGCVATAMSQIIHFHQHVGNVSFNESDSYTSGWWTGIQIDNDAEENDFPTFPELNGYLNTLRTHYNQGVECTPDDLAALCFACGISVQMSYSSDGSGAMTSDVPWALTGKFGYDSADWMDWGDNVLSTLADEARHMRPTEMSIVLEDWSGGHAINCDGYNTDSFYHLNFGWGSSDASCWYVLPAGMPNSYCIITGIAYNIEGGVAPVEVQGTTQVAGVSPVGAYIRLEGPWTYEFHVTAANGSFTLPAVYPGTYTATATLNDRLYYDQQTVVIDETHHTLSFNLGNYEAISGSVLAGVSPAGASVSLYGDANGEVVHLSTVTADANGAFSFPGQLPGDYLVTANLPGGYWGTAEFHYTIDNQQLDLPLSLKEGRLGIACSQYPVSQFHLPPNYTVSCAQKVIADDFPEYRLNAIAGVWFKTPASDEASEIVAQVWEGQTLLSEKPVSGYAAGEWVEIEFPDYVPLRPGCEYFVGYRVHSDDGNMAWFDNGPRDIDHGAFFRSTSWVILPAAAHDRNFCIDAILRTDDYGSVHGVISLDGGAGSRNDVVVRCGRFSARANSTGDYELFVPAGTQTLTASLYHYLDGVISGMEVGTQQILQSQDITLVYDTSDAGDPAAPGFQNALLGNYPNPFNPETSIRFSLATPGSLTLRVFDTRGRLVRTLCEDESMTAGMHQVAWNGTDDDSRRVGSGVYLYELRKADFTSVKKMIILK